MTKCRTSKTYIEYYYYVGVTLSLITLDIRFCWVYSQFIQSKTFIPTFIWTTVCDYDNSITIGKKIYLQLLSTYLTKWDAMIYCKIRRVYNLDPSKEDSSLRSNVYGLMLFTRDRV